MPRSTLNSNGLNTGSNYQFGDKMIAPNAPRSAFDLSSQLIRDIQQQGQVIPIGIYETLPASDYTIIINSLIKVLPQAVPLMSRQRVYTYAFYSRCSDLWDKFQTFMTKGYSGNEILWNPRELRTVGLTDTQLESVATNPDFKNASSGDKYKIKAHSMGDYYGLPVDRVIPNTDLTMAMAEMMYLRIWRDYFCNRNYYYDDKRILPDDDSRFRLVGSDADTAGDINIGSFIDAKDTLVYFDKTGLFSAGYDDNTDTWVSSKGMQYIDLSTAITVDGVDYNKLFVIAPFYHDYPDDYFVSALPWAQRGDTSVANGTALNMTDGLTATSTLTNDAVLDNLLVSASDVLPSTFPSVSASTISLGYARRNGSSLSSANLQMFDSTFHSSTDDSGGSAVWDNFVSEPSYFSVDSDVLLAGNTAFNSWLRSNLLKSQVSTSINSVSENFLTLEKLRELAVNQTIQEKMARTDGSYAEFGLTFYGEKSKSAYDYRPTFIGGNTQSVIFTEVLQTSSSTSDSPLGTYAGHGVSSDNDGFIGRVHSDDYGFIMLLACIMPDVYYTQGLDRMWTRSLQSDWYLPERAQLGMRPILNRELYVQPSTVVDTDNVEVNTKLWAYQDIFDEYRYRANHVGGQMAKTDSESFSPFTQFRAFTELPNYGKEFARANDVRTDYLAAPSESPYIATFDVNMRCVQPLPYRARPASIVSM